MQWPGLWCILNYNVVTDGSASLDVLTLLKHGLVNAQHVWVMCVTTQTIQFLKSDSADS